MENKKVVLAYSGGLDTSYCVKYLTEVKGLEVHSAFVHTGGFSKEELEEIEKNAYTIGVKSHTTLEKTEEFYQKAIKYLLFGNVLRNNTYPLSVSAERAFQAKAIVEYAQLVGAGKVAHGSTGAGNDQVRFDLMINVLAPDIEIITPIRDQKLSRMEEIEFLKKYGVEKEWSKAKYSINKGLWGTSVGGAETLTSNQPLPESAWPTQVTSKEPMDITLHFEEGECVGLNGEKMSQTDLIFKLHQIAAPYGIGRDIHVGDTIIGIKGRVGFEAAASLILIKAHHLLEKHTLSKWQMQWKSQLGDWYGMMLHEAQYLEPVMRDIEGFLSSTQKSVTGKVFITLLPYRFQLNGIESEYDIMQSKAGQYGEMNNAWSGEDVKGFTKILSNASKLYYQVNKLEKNA
ncbi:argininosuccinate synthase [Marinigracilibium pacificum]|uniref:argininosuccinate synthase n=1 Tax=Marinigracilibium pacificum TaxID=2729599 RepID=A0A848J0H6_9BACT|nr:argininosuccinate synthase domain-containing protein [Marinigracilibium pacificum]NMM49025.1 argininosuccinate synthase [Marinigracilibium pacificum]